MNNDNLISYPTRELLEIWIDILKDKNLELKLKLPKIDEDWFASIVGTIERIKISYIVGLHSKAAHLFYYINKNHNYVDGNKRSAIMVTYLFYYLNNTFIKSPGRIETLAKRLAKSHGSRNREDWMLKIEEEFSHITGPIEIEKPRAIRT